MSSSTRQSSDSSNSFGSTSGSNGRRAGTRLNIMRRNSDLSSCFSDSSTVQYPWDGYYKDKPIVAEHLPGWTIVQIGLRITSLFLAGVVAGCSIRGYLTGLILWLPLVCFVCVLFLAVFPQSSSRFPPPESSVHCRAHWRSTPNCRTE
jgi:hypothetical protein